MQREQYLREKKEGSDAYRKALDVQVKFSTVLYYFVYHKHPISVIAWPITIATFWWSQKRVQLICFLGRFSSEN